MIILDTCVLIFDALSPAKLSSKAKKTIKEAEKHAMLSCCDISLWEISMLIQKKRLHPGVDALTFLNLILEARCIHVLPITPPIAVLSTTYPFKHQDPADRMIASTALHYQAPLLTCDQHLTEISELNIIW